LLGWLCLLTWQDMTGIVPANYGLNGEEVARLKPLVGIQVEDLGLTDFHDRRNSEIIPLVSLQMWNSIAL